MSDCLIVHNDTRKSMFPPDIPCSQQGHNCWMETWLSSFHKFRRASLYGERGQTSPSWHRWNSITEQLPAKISRWISSAKGKKTFKYLYCSFLKWTLKIGCTGLFSRVTRERVTECTLFWCSFVLCSRGDISYETCSVSSLHSLQVFSEQKAIKMFPLFMIPSAWTLDISTCAALTVSFATRRLHVSPNQQRRTARGVSMGDLMALITLITPHH